MKKFFSIISILSILSQYIFIFSVFSYFEPLSGFRINNIGNPTYSFNPGDTFSIDYFTQNDFGDTIKDVFINFNFSDNTKFNYNGINQATSINWSDITNPIPSSAYNQINGFSYNITTPSYPEITNGADFWLIRKTNNYNSFNILNNISTYENTLSAWVTAKKASDNTNINGNTSIKTIYVNVKPHITNYYFEKSDGSQTTSQIQGSEAESVNLILKVKDYNGCSNISGGIVSADLSQIGLSNNESLTYQSCEGDGKTGVFKKYGITTNVSLGDKTFNSSHFIATDADGNENDANDPRFGSEDKKTNLNLTVVAASAPQVSFLSANNEKIGGPDKTSYILSFSGNQVGEYKVALGSDGNCLGGTSLSSPEWINYETANISVNEIINSSSLQEGNNSIYACIKNSGGNIGSINFNLIKDTTPPTTSFMIVSPANVINNDSSVKYSCNENGQYRVEFGGNGNPGSGTQILNWTTATASTEYTTTITNYGLLSLGANTIYGYCRDDATNISFKTGSVTKVPPTPSMVGTNIVLVDNDFDNQGLDGRDITTNWTLTSEITNATNFESYRIYLLPSNIEFNTSNQTYIQLIANKNTNSWIGTSSITKDSLNQNLVSGSSYKICIAIMGTSGQLGTESCSSPAILTADTVAHATITSAKFTSNTILEITTDTTLDTNTGSHDFSKISYVYAGNTLNPTGVASINGTKINLTIPALNNIGAIGSNIIAQTGAIRSSVGGYNNYQTFASITDGQAPTVTGYSTGTTSIYNGFYSGSLTVNYTLAEQMRASGFTKITFDRTFGNTSTQKVYNITDPTKLTSGAKNITIDLVSIGLVSGTTYDMKLVGQDLATNSVTSNAISVKFDNVGPTAPVLTDAPNTSSQTPTLSWSASTDDSGNGSGVKEYIIKIFNSADCSGGALQTLTSATTSKATNSLSNGTYSWNVYAVDNMGNIGTTSSCDSFLIDTTIPTIDNQKITDINNNNSTSFTKSGNTIKITADLTNTDITKIKADLSSLTGNASHTGVLCSAPVSSVSCIYDGGKVTYSFMVGFAGVVSELVRQIKLTVANESGFNPTESLASITVDNVAPTGGAITGPTGTIGGNTNTITFNTITEINLASVELGYILGGNYTFIHSGNTILSPYSWNTTSLTGGTYQIRLTAKDRSGNTLIQTGSTFTLDKSPPNISQPLFTNIISSEHIKGNASFAITWNSGSINDAGGLAENPITLEYSTNNGTNWTVISSTLPNTGTYSWNIPNISSLQAKLRIKARDNVGNESSYVESETCVIDSTSPTITLNTGTPPNGSYINASGFDIIASVGDNINIDSVSYKLRNGSNYWNGTTWTGSEVFVNIANNINSISYNVNSLIQPTLTNGQTYEFTLKSSDKAGNSVLSIPREFVADLTPPSLNIINLDNSYFSGSINISGTASDVGAGISSVKISIKKGSEYWNGGSWVGSGEILVTTTSNNYANWNYNFTAPGSENDGQNYEVIVYAYDKSYKENNTSSGSINIILDKSGPVIESDVFTYTSSGFYAGGDMFNLTWNQSKITSSGADFSHIKLEYNYGGVITTIVSNISNNGSYSFTLPEINGNIRPLITAYDTIGNISNTVSGSLIQVDSTPPTITSIETKGDTFGNVSGVIMKFSEEIKNPGLLNIPLIFSSSTGSFSGSYTHTIQDNKTVLELKFNTPVSGTHTAPTISWSGNIIEDLAGKKLASGNMLSIDKAQPVVLNAEIFDINNNGKLDKIEVIFSENLDDSTTDINTWSLNNAFEGLSINSVSVSNNKVNIILNEGTQFKTDTGNMSLNFTSNSNYKDSLDNIAHSKSNIALIDKAKPVLVTQKILDTNNNFEADKIELTFSENLSGTMTGFSISSGSILSTNLVGGNKVELGVDSISGTNPNINISYSGSLEDSVGNILDDFSNINLDEKISPELLSSNTLDLDGNGKIDGVLLDFSENLSGSLADLVVNVNGYTTTNNYTMSGSQSVIVGLNEKQVFDTDATPNVSIFSNNALTDNNGNKVLANQNLISTDGVGPVIIGARYEPSTHKVFMSFSETINNADFLTTNFVLQNAGSYNTESVNIGEKSLTLSGETINYSTSTVSFVTNNVRDTLGNKQTNNHYVSITAPIIINEIMVSNDINNNYIELHNLSSDTISLSGWTIAGITIPNVNIGANGYYLISKSNIGTSNINVSPDFIGNIVFSGNEIVLNNGTIDIDKASLTTGLGNSAIPASIERKSPVANGLLNSSWYTALTSTGFDNSVPLGTPGVANVFDTTSPTLSSNLTNNLLLPIGYYNLVYTYSDDILINTGSIIFNLEKWDGDSFEYNNGYNTGTINGGQTSFNISGLSYGKYKTTFSISDSAGNISSDIKEFYVDNFSFTISTGSINLGILTPNELKLSDVYVDVEVKTIGAGFEISHHYDENKLGDFIDGKGFGACVGVTCSVLENYNKISFASGSLNLTDGNLKTYNYKVRYGSIINELKEAGIYQVNNEYKVEVNY